MTGAGAEAGSGSGRGHQTFSRSLSTLLCALVLSANLMRTSSSWIDPDTPAKHRTLVSPTTGKSMGLVFSDEFEVAGRSFRDGTDPRWTAMNKNDYTNAALQVKYLDFQLCCENSIEGVSPLHISHHYT